MTTEPTILVAFDLEVRDGYENLPRSIVEHALTRLLPRSGDSLYDQGPGHFGQVDSWWVAEDDRHDGSDRDSAVFVTMGTQTAELFDRLPDEARATIRAALNDAADYREDTNEHCGDCDHGDTIPCADHAADRAKVTAYRDLLEVIGSGLIPASFPARTETLAEVEESALTEATRCSECGAPVLTDTKECGRCRADLAPVTVCATCEDYVDDPRLKPHGDGWRHESNNSVRCPGQEDDGTDDRAEPRVTTMADAFPDGIPA